MITRLKFIGTAYGTPFVVTGFGRIKQELKSFVTDLDTKMEIGYRQNQLHMAEPPLKQESVKRATNGSGVALVDVMTIRLGDNAVTIGVLMWSPLITVEKKLMLRLRYRVFHHEVVSCGLRAQARKYLLFHDNENTNRND